MTTDRKVARRKLSLLELAADLGNVSKACRVMGYSRQSGVKHCGPSWPPKASVSPSSVPASSSAE